MVAAQDFTVFGGSSGVLGSAKMSRAVAQALQQGLPLILLLDGGGHRIQDGQDSRHFAKANPMFHDVARMSGWVPMVAAMLGAGFAGPTNYAGMADFVVMVRVNRPWVSPAPLWSKPAPARISRLRRWAAPTFRPAATA